MKSIFTAFPLLKTRLFYGLLALLLVISALTGALYRPARQNEALTFEEEKSAIEEALDLTEEKLLSCSEEETPPLMQEKAFYEGALKFSLSPWSSYFASEGLSLYAYLLTAGGDGETVKTLERILTEGDKEGLFLLCEKDPSLPKLDRRLLLAEDGAQSPGRNALLYDLSLLENSLKTGKDLYFGTEKALTQGDQTLFQSLLAHKEKALLEGNFDPVPANEETLRLSERFTVCWLAVLLLAMAGYGQTEKSKASALLRFPIPMLCSLLLCALALFFSTLLCAPGSAGPVPLARGGTLPFFLALVLRMLCRLLGFAPLAVFCFHLCRKGKKRAWKLLAFLPPLHFLLQSAVHLVPREIAVFFSLGDLCDCIFPPLSAYSLRPALPWAGIALWLVTLISALFFTIKKEQKLSVPKQKLSLEKHSEL